MQSQDLEQTYVFLRLQGRIPLTNQVVSRGKDILFQFRTMPFEEWQDFINNKANNEYLRNLSKDVGFEIKPSTH